MNDEREFANDGIEEFFPYDGPHSRDRVADAAHGLSGLVRYMNNATQPSKPYTLDWAATVDRVLGGVGAAAYGLDQLFDQLSGGLERQASNPTLYDDRRDRPGADTANHAASALGKARAAAAALADAIEEARSFTHHLGND